MRIYRTSVSLVFALGRLTVAFQKYGGLVVTWR